MRILLAEDDPAIADLVKRTLEDENYEVTAAPDGTTAWDYLSKFSYSIAILDVMLPGINGLELCRRCRQANNHIPVLLLTALGTTDNIVVGLDSGADDYITKPFKILELQARVRSLIRRTNKNIGQPVEANNQLLTYAGIEMDIDQKLVKRDGRTIELTATEFRLLEYFMRNAKRVLSRMDILGKVWGYDFDANTKVVDVYINYLRKKIDNHSPVKLIHTVTGMGYVLKEE
jgi:DNA-binding response OmpR family regulator